MLAALAVAFALTGAPVSTPVTCNPALDMQGDKGVTRFYLPTPRVEVEIDGTACAAMMLLSMSPKERAATAKLNPNIYLPQVEADGASTVLHELSHVGLNSHDETAVECNAMRLLPGYLAKYLKGFDLSYAISWAKKLDRDLPTQYHERSCS